MNVFGMEVSFVSELDLDDQFTILGLIAEVRSISTFQDSDHVLIRYQILDVAEQFTVRLPKNQLILKLEKV